MKKKFTSQNVNLKKKFKLIILKPIAENKWCHSNKTKLDRTSFIFTRAMLW